ncbi:MAG TPA: AAA family ATPase [Chitinophagales bacterium]|nr:AAA family ATPase [Chitinophagales bacterium]
MNICYIWVEKFRNFENFGFNLSSSHKFKYDLENNALSKKDVDALPSNFFGERINDVVGVIGKNGSGKSNAVELVCKILKGAKTSLQTNFFVIIEEDNKLICHHSFSDFSKPKADFKISFEDYKGSINPLKVVFFSNVFDERRNEFDTEVADISVNNLFNRQHFLRREKTTDFEKQIRLINSKIFSSLNIDLPSQVQLTSKVWINRLNTAMERDAYGNNYEAIREFKKIFRDRLREIRPENKFIHLLRFGYFFEMYNNYSRRSRYRENLFRVQFENLEQFIPSLFNLRTEEISENLIDFLDAEFSNMPREQLTLFLERDEKKESESQFEKIRKQIDFLKKLKFNTNELNIEYNTEGARNRSLEYFTFNYKSRYSKSFINDYIVLFGQSNVFDINWIGISSGHKAYLNLFASLYQELRYTRQSNLLLCIDEGDLYLHPMWQIEFFDKLLTVLPTIFSGNIQLLLTSHSPFLLSDLPKQNITILDKSITGSSLDGIELKINTFGGNLYDLYSEPFFLGQKRTSDFAYNKIKSLITSVESKQISRKDKREFMNLANIIGDEVIQFRIKKILEND